jgi:hypothetical protein
MEPNTMNEKMTQLRALQHAANILQALQDTELFESYLLDEEITVEQYAEILAILDESCKTMDDGPFTPWARGE